MLKIQTKNLAKKSMKIFLSKVALFLVLLPVGAVATAANSDNKSYLIDGSGNLVRSGSGLCVRNGSWIPADAIKGCDVAVAVARPKKADQEKVSAEPPAKSAQSSNKSGYIVDGSGNIVRSGSGLCVRSSSWIPGAAVEGCDGVTKSKNDASSKSVAEVAVSKPADEPALPAAVVAAPTSVAAPEPVVIEPIVEKVRLSADTFFSFDKAVLKSKGKAKLSALVSRLRESSTEVIVATGHTDWTGKASYNQKLSMRRAKAVKAYLVSKGIPKSRVFTEGKGELEPVGDNHTRAGRAKNRRVDVEVIGTRKSK